MIRRGRTGLFRDGGPAGGSAKFGPNNLRGSTEAQHLTDGDMNAVRRPEKPIGIFALVHDWINRERRKNRDTERKGFIDWFNSPPI